MTDERLARVVADPRYRELLRRRGRLTWSLTALMLISYFGYILLIAFDGDRLARPIADGVTSIGIPLGLGVILLGIFLTGLYVRRANRTFDALVQAIRQDADA